MPFPTMTQEIQCPDMVTITLVAGIMEAGAATVGEATAVEEVMAVEVMVEGDILELRLRNGEVITRTPPVLEGKAAAVITTKEGTIKEDIVTKEDITREVAIIIDIKVKAAVEDGLVVMLRGGTTTVPVVRAVVIEGDMVPE